VKWIDIVNVRNIYLKGRVMVIGMRRKWTFGDMFGVDLYP